MLVGYARVSTLDQNPALQIAGLNAAGCERIFTEQASGAQRERPELQAALSYLRSGDTLVVWKLDRLARSIQQLLQTVDTLQTSGIELRSLRQGSSQTNRTLQCNCVCMQSVVSIVRGKPTRCS